MSSVSPSTLYDDCILSVKNDYDGTPAHHHAASDSQLELSTTSALTGNNAAISGNFYRVTTDNVTDTGLGAAVRARLTFNVSATKTFTNNSSIGIAGLMVSGSSLTGSGTLAISNFAGVAVNDNNLATGTYKYGVYVGTQSGASTNYSIYCAGTERAFFNGPVQVSNAAGDPGAVTDGIRIGSQDISAANATLSLRTETAVVTEAVTSDRTLTVFINGTQYKILLKA